MLPYLLGFLLPSHSRITLARLVGRSRVWWHHVPSVASDAFAHRLFFSAVFFFDWNTHFVVFSGGVEQGREARRSDLAGISSRIRAGRLGGLRVFWTSIPTSSFFLAASNRGWEAQRSYLAGKFARMGAGRLGGLIQLV